MKRLSLVLGLVLTAFTLPVMAVPIIDTGISTSFEGSLPFTSLGDDVVVVGTDAGELEGAQHVHHFMSLHGVPSAGRRNGHSRRGARG